MRVHIIAIYFIPQSQLVPGQQRHPSAGQARAAAANKTQPCDVGDSDREGDDGGGGGERETKKIVDFLGSAKDDDNNEGGFKRENEMMECVVGDV